MTTDTDTATQTAVEALHHVAEEMLAIGFKHRENTRNALRDVESKHRLDEAWSKVPMADVPPAVIVAFMAAVATTDFGNEESAVLFAASTSLYGLNKLFSMVNTAQEVADLEALFESEPETPPDPDEPTDSPED